MRRYLIRIAVAALLCLLAACAPPPPKQMSGEDVRTERADKEFELDAAVTRVSVDNPWGEINIRSRDEREVGIHAVIQRRAPRYATPVFRSHREGDTLRIEIGFDGAAVGSDAGRIDVAVFLPNDLALTLATRDSRISAKKRGAALEAITDSGSILASSYGQLSLRTKSGLIRATAIGARWSGASTIESGSGRIVLGVPTFGDIVLDARTGGALSTNFGLSVHAAPGGGHQAHVRYGAGTSQLRANSTNGEIVLEQLVLLRDDKPELEDDD